MRDRGIPIDFVGGASMGAVIAACVAMGWDDAEIDMRIRKAFVESNPLGDYTLPVVGMVKGVRVNARLKEHFGDVEIGDLELPFFATSTNLMTGTQRIHRTGLLRDALRATISLPGILPPVVDGNELLVDGAVLNNFPVDVMRDMHRGFVIGSDVTRQPEGLKIDEFEKPAGFFRWVAAAWFLEPAAHRRGPDAGGDHPGRYPVRPRHYGCADPAGTGGNRAARLGELRGHRRIRLSGRPSGPG
jgi:NTE family protein